MASDKKGLMGRLFGRRPKEEEEKPVAKEDVGSGANAPQAEDFNETRNDLATDDPSSERKSEAQADTLGAGPADDAPKTSATPQVETPQVKPKRGLFGRLAAGLSRTSQRLTSGVTEIFTKRKLDDEALEEFEDLLISADLGLAATEKVISRLRKERFG
ncbi:MAG: signal recognition particle receptor subunit alpha, partial [Pseudomonadota bacterium]